MVITIPVFKSLVIVVFINYSKYGIFSLLVFPNDPLDVKAYVYPNVAAYSILFHICCISKIFHQYAVFYAQSTFLIFKNTQDVYITIQYLNQI